MKNKAEIKKPIFTVPFPDGSVFLLPKVWEAIFRKYFGQDSLYYEKVAKRLCFVTGKYMENKAFPSKFDGLQWMDADKPIDEAAYDNPEFYWEQWEEWGEQGRNWNRKSGNIPNPPTWADVAEGVLYQEMRSGLLQETLQKMGSDVRVVSPEDLLKELEGSA